VAGLAEPAPLRRLQGLAGRLHARLAATDDQEAPVIGGLGGVVPHRAAQRVAPAVHQHLVVHASPVEGSWKANTRAAWALGRSTICMLPVHLVRSGVSVGPLAIIASA
jgi:hypothetical protein